MSSVKRVVRLIAGAGVTLTPNPITGVGTIVASGGASATAGHGIQINSGTIAVDTRGTIAGGGHITLGVTNGVNSVLVNGGTVATTIDVAAPLYVGQPLRLDIKQGATTEPVTLGTSIANYINVGAFTSTATAALTDSLQLIGANASQWALAGIALGAAI